MVRRLKGIGAAGNRARRRRAVRTQRGDGTGPVFLSTFEKQLDNKRRIVVPMDFRAAAAGPFGGVFCFPSIEADCIEGGGKPLFETVTRA